MDGPQAQAAAPRSRGRAAAGTAAGFLFFQFAINQNCSPPHFGQVRFRMLNITRQSRQCAVSSSRMLFPTKG